MSGFEEASDPTDAEAVEEMARYVWWGRAIPREDYAGRFHVDRYADEAHAESAVAQAVVVWSPAEDDHPGEWVAPLVVSTNQGETWHFADSGWMVPR